MFSGIVEEKAKVRSISKTLQGYSLTVESKTASKDAKIGDSIAVNGVCLTVVGASKTELGFDIMSETFRMTNLSKITAGETVNLERSLRVGDRISGHFVTGHVDCIGKIQAVSRQADNYTLDVGLPADKMMYAAAKGSIAVDGVSLTIAEVKNNLVRICLIPLTLQSTNLGAKEKKDMVNIEFDILSKYSLNSKLPAESKIDIGFLAEHGFA